MVNPRHPAAVVSQMNWCYLEPIQHQHSYPIAEELKTPFYQSVEGQELHRVQENWILNFGGDHHPKLVACRQLVLHSKDQKLTQTNCYFNQNLNLVSVMYLKVHIEAKKVKRVVDFNILTSAS